MEFKGDIIVDRTGYFARRANQGLLASAIAAPLVLDLNAARWQDITATGPQNVTLPVGTTLTNGWEVVVNAEAGSAVTVKDGAAGTLVVIPAGLVSNAFMFTLIDNGTAAGVWYITSLDNAGSVVASRFVKTFNATSDWTDQTTYWNITVTEATHGRGVNPMIQFYENIGAGVMQEVTPDKSIVQTNGDNDFEVPAGSGNLPDLRFAGEAIYI